MQTELYFSLMSFAFRKSVKEPIFSWRLLNTYAGFFHPLKLLHGKILLPPLCSLSFLPPPLQASSVCLFFTVRTTNYWTNWFLYLASYQSVLLAVLHLRGFFCCWCRKSFFFSSLPALCFRARHRLHPSPSPFFFQKSF